MRKDADGGGFIINCVNLACASNGGDNYSALKTDAEVHLKSLLSTWEGLMIFANRSVKNAPNKDAKCRFQGTATGIECCIRDLKRVIFSNYCPTDAAAKEKV